ncbi:branched-chain amino acid ABC transporter permease [Nisaea acidiphila]|uniref:Branched-chain amino acid ABC transporter permease n=1 Tax=Nisaea acidiphila TaxID=1862145 RepID=A0A9J7AVK4_9PROT|nr:branched-chain amino acid ABC transporter permease [Nisaea acidiphila]UUX51352.1 branched-chain amino acid ABC transporter permease [Nisaea acidiphila]
MLSLFRTGLPAYVMLAALAFLAALPFISEWVDNAFLMDLFLRLMVLAIAAVSLNLILGYGGMVSFGHAAYLVIGAYAVGIPAYYGIYDGFTHIVIAVLGSAIVALLTGAIALRTKGVYFIMITMAFAQMVFFTFVSIEEYGGDDGLVIDQRSEFAGLLDIEDGLTFYYFVLVSLVLALGLVHRIVHSRFGMVISGAKGNERRMQAIGFPTYRYRLVCYVISGALCGYAGALLGNFTYFITPEMGDWVHSGELIFMVVLGGAGSLFGPVLGTAVFVLLEEYLSRFTQYWHFPFGAMLILVVIFTRGGVNGMFRWLGARIGLGAKS